MSPQEGESLLEEYNGEKEQRAVKAGEVSRGEESGSEGSCEVVDGDRQNTSSDKTAMQQQGPTYDETSSAIVSSPPPVVEKGGENEFVRVSHLASVQVKAVPALSILKNKTNKSDSRGLVRRNLPRRSEDLARSNSRNSAKITRGSEDDSPYREEMSPKDESSAGKLEKIDKSPYEPGGCAENGETIFEEMKALLLEDDDNSRIVEIFGPTNAGCLVKANALVEISGMLYSQTWTKGSIRGNPVGIIPNHLLLMVLVPNRFVKASENLLSGLCRDLEVYNSVNRGLDDWGWSDDYELVRATKKNYKFKASKRDCFKCAVFVARAHSCFLAFGKRKLKPRLISKLRACLDIMEAHLADPLSQGHNGHATSNGAFASTSTGAYSTNVKKRKKMIPDHVPSTTSLVSSSTHSSSASSSANSKSHQDPPLKRKRGRPPKNSKHQSTQHQSSRQPEGEEDDSSNEEQKESTTSRSKRHHGSRYDNAASDLSLPPRRVSSRSVPSLHQLMSRFEDQYREMGQRYAEMGTLLTQMKTAIEDNRERSEQEIRRELIDEIQKNIFDSMPKR